MTPTLDDFYAAQKRIQGIAHHTPTLTSGYFNDAFGATVFFKCENFQKTGAFKIRGATNAVMALPDDVAARGVVTDSSGNHGQALAYAASRRGIPAYIVMPNIAPPVKIAAVKGYGGDVTLCEPSMAARHAAAETIATRTGATYISSCDHPDIIAGQATACMELLEDAGDLDQVLAPIGGGGLLSGTVLAAAALSPKTTVIGVEPDMADDAYRSLKSGNLIESDYPPTVADGLKTSIGHLPYTILLERKTDVVTVSEDAIITAMKRIWERMKIIVEPSSATVVAALMENKIDVTGKRVGLILSGGNVNLDALPWINC